MTGDPVSDATFKKSISTKLSAFISGSEETYKKLKSKLQAFDQRNDGFIAVEHLTQVLNSLQA